MKTARITITLPEYTYKNLTAIISTGGVSSYVAEALEEKLLKEQLKKTDPVNDFFDLSRKLPEMETADIVKAIEKGKI